MTPQPPARLRCLAMRAACLVLLPLAGCGMLPQESDNLYQLRRDAQVSYASGDDARTEKLLLGLVRAVPNDGEAWFYLGNLYARTGRPSEAAEAYQKAMLLNRSDPRPLHNLGVVRLRESWAAFIQAYQLAGPEHPLNEKLEAVLQGMEALPFDGLDRNAKGGSTASGSAAHHKREP